MQSSKIASKIASTSALNTPAGSRRNSTISISTPLRPAKSVQEIRDEMMQIMMFKGIFTSPSQPFAF
ncbi:hypothetical protein BGX29_009072 [Mortierella sp. GBA35]|nr:hypothetical protein BGX29_009072 [Mortierella sp. GBA35]